MWVKNVTRKNARTSSIVFKLMDANSSFLCTCAIQFSINYYLISLKCSSYETPTTSSSGSSENGALTGGGAEPLETPLRRVPSYHHREERAKWGDRGVTVGHFYDPLESVSVSSSVRSADAMGPDWLSRGMQAGGRTDSGVESVM